MRVKLLDKSPIELAKVPEIIKESGTLNPEQQKVHDTAKGFARQTSAKAESLKKDLKALDILRLTENHMVQIVDLLPTEAADLHAILSATKTTITSESMEKIIETVKKYAK